MKKNEIINHWGIQGHEFSVIKNNRGELYEDNLAGTKHLKTLADYSNIMMYISPTELKLLKLSPSKLQRLRHFAKKMHWELSC